MQRNVMRGYHDKKNVDWTVEAAHASEIEINIKLMDSNFDC